MTVRRNRAPVVSMMVAAVLAVAGCGAEPDGGLGDSVATAGPGALPTEDVRPKTRTEVRASREQAFLDDVSEVGFPVDMTADTVIEVGIGICQGIDDGADEAEVLEQIRPLTDAFAAQSPGHDDADVGRAIVEASRAHLCD